MHIDSHKYTRTYRHSNSLRLFGHNERIFALFNKQNLTIASCHSKWNRPKKKICDESRNIQSKWKYSQNHKNAWITCRKARMGSLSIYPSRGVFPSMHARVFVYMHCIFIWDRERERIFVMHIVYSEQTGENNTRLPFIDISSVAVVWIQSNAQNANNRQLLEFWWRKT